MDLVRRVMCFWHPVNTCLADSQQQGRSCSGFLTQRLLNSVGKSPESSRRSSSQKEIWLPLAFCVSYSDMVVSLQSLLSVCVFRAQLGDRQMEDGFILQEKICVCIYMYMYMYTCVYIYVYVCTHTCISIYVYFHMSK